jgi:NADH dehydrogenase
MERRLATVFGGSGFIGRHLVQRLVNEGWRVRVAVRDVEAAAFLKPLGDIGQIVPIIGELTSEVSVRAAVDGASLVVNLVGILNECPLGFGKKRTFQTINVDGAGRVAAAAAAAGVAKLVHLSALGADRNFASAYALSKAAGEEAVRAAFPRATILRPSVVFGPEDSFFNRFAKLASFTPILPVYVTDGMFMHGAGWFGSGGPHMQPVYVGDVADAIMAAVHGDAPAGRTYELGGPRVYSLKEIQELMLKASGRKRWLVPMPLWWGKIHALFLQFLPNAPLTPDQVRLLTVDNIVSRSSIGLAELGIEPVAAEVVVPTYLGRYRNPYIHRRLPA